MDSACQGSFSHEFEMNSIDMMMNAYSQQELFVCSVNDEHHNQ